MSTHQTLSTPVVKVNGDQKEIVPNTLGYNAGHVPTNVRAADAGNGATAPVFSRNAEEGIGKVKFEMFPVAELDSFIAILARNVGTNVIEFAENFADGTTVTRSFLQMALVTDPEVTPTSDGTTPLEFAGAPMVQG